jgi:hypothetical protein
MKPEPISLAARRAQLIDLCAQQRGDIADALNLLQAPAERISGAAGFLHRHRKTLLAGAGLLFGLVLARPGKVLGLVASGASVWKLAQAALPTVQRLLPLVRARWSGQVD